MDYKRCEQCGRQYGKGTRNWTQYRASRFCSQECSGTARTAVADKIRDAASKQCLHCGKSYGPRYGEWAAFKDSKFCSHECANQGKKRSLYSLYAKIRIDPVTGCHEWQGYRNSQGYGMSRFNGRKMLVHRIVWENTN